METCDTIDTDAGAEDYSCPVCNGDCAGANPPVTYCPMRDAPTPPAAADRGVPGQVTEEMVNAAWTKFEELNDGGGVYRDAMKFAIIAALAVGPKNEALEAVLKCFDEPMEIWPTGWREKYPALTTPSVEVIRSRIKAFVARAALATAPKAEDVRREAIEECAKFCDRFTTPYGRAGSAPDAIEGQMKKMADAIRALAEPAQ